MNLGDLHRRLLSDVLAIGTPYPLVITGGYAVQAHGLVDRLSQDLDVATENPAPMAEITRSLVAGAGRARLAGQRGGRGPALPPPRGHGSRQR
ncbi:hypothetical protein BJY27_000377 [Streptomyces rapamycinicus]|uniref:Uncharacterized protein n=2 Tax=Streptomyces rapamycinicus TaxID=1226757 RepID=A0A3L8R8C0_STRRN|nr:hypothetical protein [Streptomyces rapamycinicus]RLV75921.1 hypothetical protein D3C57_141885 [Streptomyces rapamycinicus NRRL 5491]